MLWRGLRACLGLWAEKSHWCPELNGRFCGSLEDKHAESNVDAGYLACQGSLKALLGPLIFLTKNHTCETLLYWNNGSWSSEAEESFAIKKAKPSGIFPLHHYRETSPELGEMPSHSSSQSNSVRVTQVFGFEEGVMESC